VLTTALIITFIICCLINVIYWSVVCTPLNLLQDEDGTLSLDSHITILVCSKNDSENLQSLLLSLDSQINVSNQIEILIVDDYSNAQECDTLSTLESRFPIRVIKADQDLPGKKAALLTGIKAVSSGIILLTDADCRPRPEWITTLSQQVTRESAVLGYSPFARRSGSVNLWARYEGFITAIQYLGWAAHGKPYLGVGRSIALHSESVKSLSLPDLNPEIASGDDDMLIQFLHLARPVLRPSASVETDAPQSWRAYWRQKRRHYSISPDYHISHQIRLSLFSVSQILIMVLGITCVVMGVGHLAATVWCIRLLCIGIISWTTFGRLEQRDLWFLLPILDGLLSIYYLVFGMTLLLPKPKSW